MYILLANKTIYNNKPDRYNNRYSRSQTSQYSKWYMDINIAKMVTSGTGVKLKISRKALKFVNCTLTPICKYNMKLLSVTSRNPIL